MITQWPWLQGRLKQDARDVRRLDRLIMRSQEWVGARDEKKPVYVASHAERELFSELAKNRPSWLSPIEMAFVTASDEAYEAELDRERARQRERDDEQARRLADAEKLAAAAQNLAAAERCAAERTRMVLAVGSLLAVAVIGGLTYRLNEERVREAWNWFTVMKPYKERFFDRFALTLKAEEGLRDGETFRECERDCPEMVVVPPGSFLMGTDKRDIDYQNEWQKHLAQIGYWFAVAKYDVTLAQWKACVDTGGCLARINSDFFAKWRRQHDEPTDPQTEPVVNVSWVDAQTYAAWLSLMTGKRYRLLSETEWEYSARAGSTTRFYWGDVFKQQPLKANCVGCGSPWDNREASPVGSFPPNRFGLFDMSGNVWQWVADCVNGGGDGDYQRTPWDGAAWVEPDCPRHYLRGGSYTRPEKNIRPAARLPASTFEESIYVGFRVARDLAQP